MKQKKIKEIGKFKLLGVTVRDFSFNYSWDFDIDKKDAKHLEKIKNFLDKLIDNEVREVITNALEKEVEIIERRK